MANGYRVRYYQKENDTLKSHSASYMTDVDFDKAEYSWLTDTSETFLEGHLWLKEERNKMPYSLGIFNS